MAVCTQRRAGELKTDVIWTPLSRSASPATERVRSMLLWREDLKGPRGFHPKTHTPSIIPWRGWSLLCGRRGVTTGVLTYSGEPMESRDLVWHHRSQRDATCEKLHCLLLRLRGPRGQECGRSLEPSMALC